MSRLPAARRKEQLLDVALHEFAQRGFHTTSMHEVADAAGVTKPVLYQHFPSKRALYLELLRDVGARLLRAITDATSEAGGPREQVERGLGAYFRFVAEHRAAYRLMFGGGTRRDEEFAAETTRVERAMAEVIAGLIEVDGLDADDRLLFAYGIVGLAEGTTRWWVADDAEAADGASVDGAGPAEPTRPRSCDEVAVRVADLAWRGLRGVRSDQP